jgi:hypothetical protein
MAAELLQFAMVLAAFVVAALLWLYIVYVPGRTVENWEDQRPARRGGERGDRGRSA